MDIGVGQVVSSTKSKLLIQFYGGGTVEDEHRPCFYTTDKQKKEMGGAFFYYGEPLFWTKKQKKKLVQLTNAKYTIEVPRSAVVCAFKWTDDIKIPEAVLHAHCSHIISKRKN